MSFQDKDEAGAATNCLDLFKVVKECVNEIEEATKFIDLTTLEPWSRTALVFGDCQSYSIFS